MKIFQKVFCFPLLFLIFSTSNVFAAASYTQGSTAQELADQIQGVGITITNPVITHGADTQVGIFSNAIEGAGLEIDEGIILTCMTVDESFTTNSSWRTSLAPSGTHSDIDLLDIDNRAFYNPVIFEFDVTLDENTKLLLIDYQFASEEYPEYVGSRFNDTFGFFISGGDLNQTYNIARVVDNTTYVNIDNINDYPPVTVNNVNGGELGANDDATPQDLSNSEFYIDNNQNNDGGTSPILVEYDGLTHTLHATLDRLTPGETYHFKMALADTADSQWDTGVFINKINGLREPSICYDYSYKQDGQFITEDYNSSSGPYITADVSTTSPIEVGMYFKNTQESEIIATNVKLNILDINTTQATYAPDSIYITETQSIEKIHIPDLNSAGMSASDGSISNIPVESFNSLEYFYMYFSLDPLIDSIHIPINAQLTYDLTIPLSLNDSVTISRSSLIDSQVPMCSGSNFEYFPIIGIFNVVHENYYNTTSSYYNLPTQVTKREGNFKVLSMDSENPDELKGISTIVAVEMIDVSGYHDTDPSCKEMGSTISERVWVIFDDNATSVAFNKDALTLAITNGMTKLNNSYDFYTNARENAAFRISYNVVDENNSMPFLAKDNNGDYSLLNWNMNWEGESCVQDMNGNPNDNDSMAGYCNLTNNNFTDTDLAACMECIYGIDTRFVCSRDNFAIRPEAFLINIYDQNQTGGTSQTKLTTDYSGVTSPTPDILNLAAEYDYGIKVIATDYLGNDASIGYTRSFSSVTPDDSSKYIWEPRSSITQSSCNDINDSLSNIDFSNGVVDMNTSATQVGEYRLNILDKTWTTVDNNPDYMTHHTGNYYIGADIPDCVLDSSVVKLNDPYPTTDILNGCNISSNHTNDNANLVYNDIDVTFHPYKFDLNSITQSFGIDNNTTLSANSFIYMADTSFNNNQDENLSFHLNGFIKAVGYDGTNLSNFTSQCYAKPINIDINNSDTTLSDVAGNAVAYQAKLHNLDINATLISADTIDVDETTHNTPMQIQVPTSNFTKLLNGSINTRLNLNFNRVNNVAANPIRVSYDSYNVECTDAINDCTFSADLVTKTTRASLDVDQNITHYYGRTHAPLYRYAGPSGDGLIYYEVFCNGAGCDKTLLQDGVNSRYNDDPRWFINTKHSASLGTANTVTQKGSRANITATNANGNNIATGKHPDSFTFTYDAVLGYPYKGTMQNNASRWLIYNPYNANDTTNEFNIEYDTSAAGWSGVNQTDSSTSNDGASRTNRRSMW